MIYRKYGSTGKDVSVIGFGGMRFKDQKDVDQCASLVKASYDAGINYFDTACGYGKSEELFGVAFKEMLKSRNQKPFYVSTKTMKANPGEIRKQLETSLTRMGLDYVDFYHVWCIRHWEDYEKRKVKGLFDGFEKLKAEGLIKHICISSHLSGQQTGAMLADYPFDGVLLGYSVMNFAYRQAALETAAEKDMGIAIMNPLGGGMIPQYPERFDFVKTRENETVAEGALRFLIDDQRISTILVGLSDQDQLAQAISAVNGYKPLSDQMVEKIKSDLSDAFNKLCTMCGYCDKCPQKIAVPKYMGSYNNYILNADSDALLKHIKDNWDIDFEDRELNRCSECGLCQRSCTQNLPIIERLRFIQAEIEKHLEKNEKEKEDKSQ